MKKKLLAAVVIAATMIMANVLSVFAAGETVEATGWWVAHSSSVEVTEAGVVVTMHSVSDTDADKNWHTPIVVVYTADQAFAGGAGISDTPGYSEYMVGRSDAWAWNAIGDSNAVPLIAARDDAEGAWDNFIAANIAGVDVKVTAKLESGKIVFTVENNGIKTTYSTEVDTTKPVYISISGEKCTITNITATPNAADPETGDSSAMIYSIIAMVVALAVGAYVVISKKKVTE